MFSKIKPSHEIWGIILTLLIFTLVRLFINVQIELAPDEAYYWYWGKHLDFGYADHPPMVAYVMAIFTAIGGNTEFFVRLGGLLLSMGALFIMFHTSRTLFPANHGHESQNKLWGKNVAWELLFIFNITLLFSAGCIVQTPDQPMLFFWTAAVFLGSLIITKGSPKYWYLWGVFLGLGLLSKYTMILIVPCFFLFFLISPEHRFWLKKKEPYIALLIAFLVFSPVLYWNWQHQWVSFLYQLHQGLDPKRRDVVQIILKLLEYAGGQAGIVTPLLFIAFVIYAFKGTIVSLRENRKEYLYLVLLSLPILLFFGLSTALGKVAEANWPAPAYVAGGLMMVHIFHEYFINKKVHRLFIASGIVLALLINIIVHIHFLVPFLPISPKLDPFQQFHGWRALGANINKYVEENPYQDGYFILGDKGTTVAEAVFYTQNRFIGIDFDQPQRYIFLNDVEYLRGKNAIIVMHNPDEKAFKRYNKYFQSVEKVGAHDCIFRNEKIDWLSVQLGVGKDYRGNWVPFH
ncbi:MAG: glycosyltransferase family 39 protein [Deltaproteobacteria bacterium]|nr:glycosyltransferase family 39 protein [Deltaproteobacteria bacterium]